MNSTIFAIMVELSAKVALQTFFGYMRALEKSESEIRSLFIEEKHRFFERRSKDLPQVKPERRFNFDSLS